MKNHVFLMLFVVGILGCDRLKVDEQAKIQINLPQAQSVMSSKGMVTTFGGRPVPSGVTGATPINCYLIGVGGPEEALQRNICKRDDTSSANTFSPRKIGLWVGAAAAGSSLAVDVPSGKDRVIYVVGFHAISAAACRDFKTNGFPDDSELSYPYLMGEKGGLELKPGETKDLPLEVSFSENNRFDNCKGPDFPERDGGGGGGNNQPSTPAKLVISKNYFPFETFANNSCQSFDLVVEDAVGRQSSFASSFTVTPQVHMDSAYQTMYESHEDCTNYANPQTVFTFPANASRKQVVFRTTGSFPVPVTITLLSNTAPTPLATAPAIMTNQNASLTAPDLLGPDRLLPNVCYPMTAKLKQIANGPASNYSTTVGPIQYDFSAIGVYTTLADCQASANAIVNVTYPSYQTSVGLFVKMKNSSADTVPIIFPAGTFQPNTRKLYRGDGSSTASRLEIRGFNQFSGVSSCGNEAHEVFLANEKGVPVVATTATSVSLSGTGVSFYNNVSDCYSATSPINVANIAVGETSGKFFVRPDAPGAGMINATVSGFTPGSYPVTISGPTILAFAPMGPTSVATTACIPVSAILRNPNGSVTQNYGTTVVVTVEGANSPSSFTIYEDPSCTTGAGGSLTISGSGAAMKDFGVKVNNQTGANITVTISGTVTYVPSVISLPIQVGF